HDGAQRAGVDDAPPAVHDLRRDVMAAGNGHNASKGGYFLDTEQLFGAGAAETAWPGATHEPLPPLRTPITGKARIDVGETLRGKHVLLIGTTGFVGKVA